MPTDEASDADRAAPRATERFTIRGAVASPRFPPWIERHGARLGLVLGPVERRDGALAVVAEGPRELLDALEMGVSLGPIEVAVETVERAPEDPR